ncbi:MAG: efflux RND transporter periplasmic adaptor subunit [Ignavibacteriaceae bacterium]
MNKETTTFKKIVTKYIPGSASGEKPTNGSAGRFTFSDLSIESIKKDKRLLFGIPAVLILLILFIYYLIPGAETTIPTYKVKKGVFLVSITESGEVAAKTSVSISTPRVRGNLKIVYLITQGTFVKAEDTVVRFDPTEAISQLKEAESKLEITLSNRQKLLANQEAQLTSSQSNMGSAELAFELSKLSLEQIQFEAQIKQQEVKLQHKRNELAFTKAKQDFASLKIVQRSELNNLDIEVKQRKSELERAQRDLEQLTLKAPADGLVVYETNWSTGRKIALGDTPWSGMTIVTIPDLTFMQSITYVNEVDVSKVRAGIEVLVKLDAFQDSTFKGIISSVASLGKIKDNNSSIKVFEIAVDIKSQSEILKPGMTTSNKIIINQIPNSIFIPHESIFEKDGKKIVYVKNGPGFDERVIELGEKSEDFVIVKSGLEDEEELALRDPTIDLTTSGDTGGEGGTVTMPPDGKK